MLLGTVLLWALNVTVTKYVLDHGWQPLAYATIRYFAATALFWGFTYSRERSFEIPHGPCCSFTTPGGKRVALYQRTRPEAASHFDGRRDF